MKKEVIPHAHCRCMNQDGKCPNLHFVDCGLCGNIPQKPFKISNECGFCYGKGYSTTFDGIRTHAQLCACERADQLKKHFIIK